MAFTLRPYQHEAIEAVYTAYTQKGRSKAVIEMPPGLGKTVTAREINWKFAAGRTHLHILFVAPFIDLAKQPIETFLGGKGNDYIPRFRQDQLGLVQGSNNEVGRQVIFASAQTLDNPGRMRELLYAQGERKFGIIIIDECHLGPQRTQRILDQCLAPSGLVIGLSATPYCSDDFNLATVFPDGMFYTTGFFENVVAGYLCDISEFTIPTSLDLTGIVLEEGEDEKNKKTIARYKNSNRYQEAYKIWTDPQGLNYRPCAIYAQNIADACAFRDHWKMCGHRAEVITSATPPEVRAKLYADLATGAIDMLANLYVMTTGLDIPQLSAIIIARRMNRGTFTQTVGRVGRIHASKWDAQTQSYRSYVAILKEHTNDNDYELMTMGSLIGSKDTRIPSIRRALQEKLEQETDAPPTDIPYGEQIYHRLNQSQALAHDMFTGKGWLLLPGTKRFHKSIPGVGSVEAIPTLSGLYSVAYTNEATGQTRSLTKEALPIRDALVRGQEHLKRQEIRGEVYADSSRAAGITTPITFAQWMHLARRRIPGVPSLKKGTTKDEMGYLYQQAKASGLTEGDYLIMEKHLKENGNSNMAIGPLGRISYNPDTKTTSVKK